VAVLHSCHHRQQIAVQRVVLPRRHHPARQGCLSFSNR
jgi:hypothetical protein